MTLSESMQLEPESEPRRRSWPRRLLNRLEVDRAVFYAVAGRGWQFLAGPVTIVLIALHFSPDTQGYYYTFWSLIALQAFVDLGLQIFVVSASSHEWARLSIDENGEIVGDETARSRLISLGQLVLKWYAATGVLFAIGVGIGGVVFFRQNPAPSVSWMHPWFGTVLLTGVLIWLAPCNWMLEGCNQVVNVNLFRLVQAVAGNFVVWGCIVLGAGLWTVVAASLVRLLCELYLVCVHYRRFFRPFLKKLTGPRMGWRDEVWPMQWQMAVKGIAFYFVSYAITPIMFHYHGATVAGQMGMTWTVLGALQMAASAWVQTRAPRFGMLIAKGDYAELDRIFNRLAAISISVLAVGCVAFCSGTYLLYWLKSPYADRLLSPSATVIFSVVVVLSQIPNCEWIYIHAHRRTLHTPLALAVLFVEVFLIFYLGSRFGPAGAGAARLLMVVLFSVPIWTYVWYRCREAWH
jgi:O-antigen/teichoic acid export membrane protein